MCRVRRRTGGVRDRLGRMICRMPTSPDVEDVKSSFGPQFKVTERRPDRDRPATAWPAETAARDEVRSRRLRFASRAGHAGGVKGNMAATTAEGEGNRFIAIAVETSEAVPSTIPPTDCKKVGFTGGGMRGLVEVVEAPRSTVRRRWASIA